MNTKECKECKTCEHSRMQYGIYDNYAFCVWHNRLVEVFHRCPKWIAKPRPGERRETTVILEKT